MLVYQRVSLLGQIPSRSSCESLAGDDFPWQVDLSMCRLTLPMWDCLKLLYPLEKSRSNSAAYISHYSTIFCCVYISHHFPFSGAKLSHWENHPAIRPNIPRIAPDEFLCRAAMKPGRRLAAHQSPHCDARGRDRISLTWAKKISIFTS